MGYAPFVSQIITLRSLSFNLAQLNGKYADYLLERYKELISHPLLYSEAKRLSTIAFPQLKDSTYALPEGPATEVFRNVIKNHAGKVLFIDFWSTNCGPCRSGIEQMAYLRQQYKDHPDFQFIFLTSDDESPEEAYNKYH